MQLPVSALFPTFCPKISDEQFNLYHSMERRLYSRLIFDLGREPDQSVQVMGFWIWIELVICTKMDLVPQLLMLPDVTLDEVAGESVVCLKCVDNKILPFKNGVFQLILLPKLVRKNISLELLHECRITVINGVTRKVRDVCARAFKDIPEKTLDEEFSPREVGWSYDCGISNSFARSIRKINTMPPQIDQEQKADDQGGELRILPIPNIGKVDRKISTTLGNKSSSFHNNGGVHETSSKGKHVFQFPYKFGKFTPLIGVPIFPPAQAFCYVHHAGGNTINMQQQIMHVDQNLLAPPQRQNEMIHGYEVSDNAGRLSILQGDINKLLPDDRTIFLTFSKGYPISASELKSFFTWKFGDFVEAIYMQEVGPGEQALYARVVSRSAMMVDVVIAGGRAKYTINGRHAWARKYVKKQK